MRQEPDGLYQAMGGEEGIAKLVGAFYRRVLTDESLSPFFDHVPMERLKVMQKEFFSEALGGPLFYSGRSLRQVHAGMGIEKEHVRRFVQHLLDTLLELQGEQSLTRSDIDAIYSRIALEVDRVTDDVGESG